MRISKREVETMLTTLRDVRDISTMRLFGAGIGEEGKKLTEMIKAETKLWRETWILPNLDNTIRLLEAILKQ